MRSIVWIAALVTGCGAVKQATVPAAYELHLGEAWFEHRARTLGISVEAAKARDASFAEEEPPEGLWDETTSVEAAGLWRDLCAQCHGPNGDPEEAPNRRERSEAEEAKRSGARPSEAVGELETMPRDWSGMGPAMGFFFGGDKMRAGIYRRIRDGGDADGKPSKMPRWGEQLAREQIWALVQHIEGF
jgi:mono/diheme cytochrome c family protein